MGNEMFAVVAEVTNNDRPEIYRSEVVIVCESREDAVKEMHDCVPDYINEFAIGDSIEDMKEEGTYQEGTDPKTGREFVSCSADLENGFWLKVVPCEFKKKKK